jgi:hypothetical protein
MSKIAFHYDRYGRGDLVIDTIAGSQYKFKCRTGSINEKGVLVNACPVGSYEIREESALTCEKGMRINGELGRKSRLYFNGKYTHLLIHYDEFSNGTSGCIGTIDPTFEVYAVLDFMIKSGHIPVEVTRDE